MSLEWFDLLIPQITGFMQSCDQVTFKLSFATNHVDQSQHCPSQDDFYQGIGCSCSCGPSKLGQKTGLNLTFKH